MKKQWKKFLEDHVWSYGIVPKHVYELDKAVRDKDFEKIKKVTEDLLNQGIIIDDKDNLRFMTDFMMDNVIRR